MSYKLSDNYEAMYHGAVNAGVQYLLKYKSIKSLIIGVSGGIDSAISCMLARAVCDKLIDREVTLIGRSIAIESNTKDEIKRAKEVGKAFCHDFEHVDLTKEYYVLYETFAPGPIVNNFKIRRGNIKARLRMIYLYDLAFEHDGLVLSNDNLTEYMLGFWTLHGDVGDLGLIQNLWKTEVYGLAEWYVEDLIDDSVDIIKESAIDDCINAVPTDGLGVTNSDLDQLLPGYHRVTKGDHREGYKRVDNTLISHLVSPQSKPHIKEHNPVVERHLRTQFKRDNPFSVDRNLLIP
jgi:NAD+ synthetase